MTARSLWGRLAFLTAAAGVLALALSPPQPPLRLDVALALLPGAASGALLFVVVARRRPGRVGKGGVRLAAARSAVLALAAVNEEILWRRVLLGELLPAGAVAALAASSAAFALAHRRSRIVHLVTGGVFGGVYLLTGALAASVSAHWAYNLLLATLVQRTPP